MKQRSLFLGAVCFWLLLTFNASATTRYVDLNCASPAPPYTGWSTAATNIQDAVDASSDGDLVLVTNGVYATGGRMWFDSGTNRVTLTNAVTLQSVNGPEVTLIVGNQVAGTGSILTNTARCVGMGNNAVLSGFTLTNGEAGSGNYPTGGGVANIVSGASTVTNCVLISNLSPTSYYSGGGADRVTLINCKLIGNHAGYGGGASACGLINCIVVSNTASDSGGGLYLCNANQCLVVSNSSAQGGGGYGGSYYSSTIAANSATTDGGGVYGGSGAWLYNSIAYSNSAPIGPDLSLAKMEYCCTTPPVFDTSNITNPPAFINPAIGDFRLQSNSPCINAGNNSFVTNSIDLDGNPRIVGGSVDMGAYEYQTPGSMLSYAWAQQYGLPTDGTADNADTDGDGMNNYAEWKARTSPTNSLSLLQLASPVFTHSPDGIVVTWQSVVNVIYDLQRSSDLAGGFSSLQSGIAGLSDFTSFTDTTATNGGPYFYRVGVQ